MPAVIKKQSLEESLRAPSLALNIVNQYVRWILLLIVGVTLFIGYTYIIQRKMNELLNVAQQSLPAKEKVLSDLKVIKRELDSIVVDFNVLKNNKKSIIDKFDQMLPTTANVGELFIMLDTVTRKAGFTMTSVNIAFGTQTQQAPSGFQVVQPSAGSVPDTVSLSSIKPLSIHMAVQGGTYESFKVYLNLLQRNIRLFDLQSLSLDGASYIPDKDGKLPTPHYDLELTTYYRSTDGN